MEWWSRHRTQEKILEQPRNNIPRRIDEEQRSTLKKSTQWNSRKVSLPELRKKTQHTTQMHRRKHKEETMTKGFQIKDLRTLVEEYKVSFEMVARDYNKIDLHLQFKQKTEYVEHAEVMQRMRTLYEATYKK